MSLFSAISKKLNMSEEERAIEKEAKSLLSDFNSLISRYEIWYSNCNNKNKTYQSMLSFREIDENMLKESKLDISIDNLEKSYNILNNYIQPSIKFSMSMKEKNIKMNNMDLNEKKLIIDPLRKHIFHMKDWEVKKNLFEDNLSKAYESVINKFAIINQKAIKEFMMSEKFTRPSKDEYFKEIVQVVAKRSTCNHAQVGALLVSPNGQLLSTGYNGAVSGMPHCTDIGCTEDKYGHCVATVHAEQNAIAQAAKHGISPEGAILYTTLFPCLACLKLVVAAGVKEIKYIDEYHAKDPYEELLIDTLEIACEKI